GKMG
ncbi:bacterial regulatory s, gntR family protein, partial [Escherichia coli 96.0939]